MGRKKKRGNRIKPFCYYCDRGFDDEKVLIQHQKAKHFKCNICCRKLDTATGLAVHLLQVHKEQLGSVPNALSGRDSVDVIVHGMDGIPNEIIQEKLNRYQLKQDGKLNKKKQRANWAQVTMAPTSLEHFIILAQQGQLPQFDGVPPTPVIPGIAANLPSFAAATAGAPPALPAPPNLQGLLSQATGMPLQGMPGAAGGPQGPPFVYPMGGPPGPHGMMPHHMQQQQQHHPQQQQQQQQGGGPGGPHHGVVPPGLGQGPPTTNRGGAPNSSSNSNSSSSNNVPVGPPPVFSTPPLPSSTRLMYTDDAVSVEERRAAEVRRY